MYVLDTEPYARFPRLVGRRSGRAQLSARDTRLGRVLVGSMVPRHIWRQPLGVCIGVWFLRVVGRKRAGRATSVEVWRSWFLCQIVKEMCERSAMSWAMPILALDLVVHCGWGSFAHLGPVNARAVRFHGLGGIGGGDVMSCLIFKAMNLVIYVW